MIINLVKQKNDEINQKIYLIIFVKSRIWKIVKFTLVQKLESWR